MNMNNETSYLTSIKHFLTDMSPNVNRTERIASVAAGGALLGYGIKRGGWIGALSSAVGGEMLYRGTTGHCHLYDATGINTRGGEPLGTQKSPNDKTSLSGRIHVTENIRIDRPANVVYTAWKNFENFPRFMEHVESVTRNQDDTWHWVAKAPLGTSVEWDARVTSDIQDQRIGWQATKDSQIPNSGVVEFVGTPDDATDLTVTMIYEAPAGKFGEWVAWALGEEPHIQVADDLRRFKELVEKSESNLTASSASAK
jgi:uncharacterized membrane protein